MPDFIRFPLVQLSSSFTDRSVTALTSSQASGAEPVLAANSGRTALAIYPENDGYLFIEPASDDGIRWPLYAGVTRTFTGAECPNAAIYVTGQRQGQKLRVAEA